MEALASSGLHYSGYYRTGCSDEPARRDAGRTQGALDTLNWNLRILRKTSNQQGPKRLCDQSEGQNRGGVRTVPIHDEPIAAHCRKYGAKGAYCLRGTTPTQPIAANQLIPFKVDFENVGNANATNARYDGRAYVAKLNDIEAENKFIENFNKWWKESKHKGDEKAVIVPGSPVSTFTFYQDFTADQVKEAENPKASKAVYYLVRIVYSDQDGR